MSGPLSSDLRKRIVLAYEEGDKTRDEVAEVFQVGRASVNRLVKAPPRPRLKGPADGRSGRASADEQQEVRC